MGKIGEARTAIHQEGSVLIDSELWSARSQESIPAGEHVRVVKRDGFTLEVEPESNKQILIQFIYKETIPWKSQLSFYVWCFLD